MPLLFLNVFLQPRNYMLETPFTQFHIALGAKMAPFAGYNMPISYEGINAEHLYVRNHVGIFDVSHMGEFIVRGEGALDLLQRITSNDVSKLQIGDVQYSCMTNDVGGIVDDLLVYRLSDNAYMLVVNASNIEKDWQWVLSHNNNGVECVNISDKTALLAVQGPKAIEALQSLTDIDLTSMKYYTFVKGIFAGCENILVSATGYTGAGGFEIYMDNHQAVNIWNAIMNNGNYTVKPAGLGARDTLRLEKGFCLYGNDIDDNTSPLEAGLGWITKFNKDFTAKTILENQKANGLKRKLVGFEMIDRGIPRHGYEVCNENDEIIGVVTSGTQSPSLNKALGLAYVKKQHLESTTDIFIKIREKNLKAQVVKIPFIS